MRETIAQAAAVLPASMQLPARATIGTPRVSSETDWSSLREPTRAGTPIRSPRNGNCSTTPRTRQSKGRPLSGLIESHTPSTPPMFSICMTSPGFSDSGMWPE